MKSDEREHRERSLYQALCYAEGEKRVIDGADMTQSEQAQKTELLAELEATRQRTFELVDSLSDEQLEVPYHPGVNPPLWEMGHASFFYEVFVFNLLDGTPSYDPSMDDLWDSFHIDHGDRWSRKLFPGREQTLQYFNTIYDRVASRIAQQPLTDEALYLYRYAIYHQHMHIESMTWCRQTVALPAPPALLAPCQNMLSLCPAMHSSPAVATRLECRASLTATPPPTLPLMGKSRVSKPRWSRLQSPAPLFPTGSFWRSLRMMATGDRNSGLSEDASG